MKVEQACKLSSSGVAKSNVRVRTSEGSIMEISLYARFNEIRDRYSVTPYYNRQKLTISKRFVDPHKINNWKPSRGFSAENRMFKSVKTEYCLYMIVSKSAYQFCVGLTNNLYSMVYQLRLIFGEFDLDSSCVVYGTEPRLRELENILHFIFEEYHYGRPTIAESAQQGWFDLDCFWYMKNEIRRMQSFREDKIYRVYDGIDLNAYLINNPYTILEGAEVVYDE